MPKPSQQLRDEYRSRLAAIPKPIPEAKIKSEWRRYLALAFYEVSDPEVFRELSRHEFLRGMDHIFRFIRKEIDPVELVAETRKDVSDAYIANLQSAGLLGDLPPNYEDVAEELHLELLKAYMPLDGLDPESAQTCSEVTIRGSRIWCRFVDKLHPMGGLPAAVKLASRFLSLSVEQTAVMMSGQYDAYAMKNQAERDYYLSILYGKK